MCLRTHSDPSTFSNMAMDPQPREFLMWYAFYTIYMMDHISSQFKNELQKKIWRRFPSSFKRICHAIFSQMSPQFLCRKNFRENRNSALNHEKTFFTILWSNLENAESLKWSLTLEIMIVIINQLCLYCSASPVDFLWPQNTVCCQIVNISKVHLIGSSF